MNRNQFLIAALWAIGWIAPAQAEPIAVKHIQRPMQRTMVVHSDAGTLIAHVAFSQAVQGDEVTTHMTYKFLDGSMDDETTTFRQQGAFQFLRNHQLQKGPFFAKALDFTVEGPTGMAVSRTVDKNGKTQVESHHINLPNDLANGFVGTLLLNVPQNAAAFRVGMLVPVDGGRLIRLLISADSEQPFQMSGKTLQATVFRIHPELGGVAGAMAPMFGLQPKDVMVWVLEGEEPQVVRVVGQLGGEGPIVSSELDGTSFAK